VQLVQDLSGGDFPSNVDAVVAPTFLHLSYVREQLSGKFKVAAQNCSQTGNGAYTGEISPDMIKDFGLDWVILGHSERRAYYGETNEVVGAKVKIAQASGLSVIACLGETLQQRESGVTTQVVTEQLKAIAANVADWDNIVIAYEPVWAIGTGKTASPEQAQAVHKTLRDQLRADCGDEVADSVRIIYGGSVKDKNCDELIKKTDIDGFLVGGAALKGDHFLRILRAKL
jgi:triosephosphate isomerase (TIM)